MEELVKYLKSFSKINQKKLLEKVYKSKKTQKEIIDFNRIDQLYNKGIDSDGKSLGEYSPNTIEGTINYKGKKQKGQPYDRITLKDTGEFYSTFDLVFNSDLDFEIVADDEGKGLFYNFGDNILGFTDGNKDEIIADIQNKFIDEVQRAIFKGL